MSADIKIDEHMRAKLKNLLDFIQNANNLTEEQIEAKLAEDPELKAFIDAIDIKQFMEKDHGQ